MLSRKIITLLIYIILLAVLFAIQPNLFFDNDGNMKCFGINSNNVNDNVNDTVIIKDIVSRKLKFSDSLKPFINVYPRETLNDFYKYWTEPNKSNTKFRQELEKTWDNKRRLENWTRHNKNFKKETEVITFKKPFK